ncbi:hypothetical protein O1M63_26375 [Streptomyces mirabilis]|nr:hypothetical protein [Streptomyces mirabilis]
MTAIDELLADARIPTGPRDGFDVGAALRRLAADAAAVAARPHLTPSALPRPGSGCPWCAAGSSTSPMPPTTSTASPRNPTR